MTTYEQHDLRKGADIAARLLDLGSGVVRLVRTLPKDAAALVSEYPPRKKTP